MVVIRTSIACGRWAGILVALGGGVSLFVHASLSAIGVSALLIASPAALQSVKIAGAGYLMYLGVRSLTGAGQVLVNVRDAVDAAKRRPDFGGGLRRAFVDGFLTNLLNPKVSVFYLAILPQYIEPGQSGWLTALLLTAIHFSMAVTWKSTIACIVDRIRQRIVRPGMLKALSVGSGIVLIAFAVRLLLPDIR